MDAKFIVLLPEGQLYRLENGNHLRIVSMCDDPDCDFGYDYFDGKTKKLIDGGVFNLDEDEEPTIEAVLRAALSWCDLSTETKADLIMANCEYSDLEEMGYTGF